MPIKDKSRYPDDWDEISYEIRFCRAGERCECDGRCGDDHNGRCTARNNHPHPITGSAVVLTVAHLDHTPENCDYDNLMAMCQKCHNNYDVDFRRGNRIRNERKALIEAGQMVLFDYLIDKEE